MADRTWDVFTCHASEDKNVVARPLANALAESGVRVWLDEGEIKLGDSIRQKIDQGLAHSRFGAVVLSPSFFSKRWPASELDALFSREYLGTKVVLPIWHGLTVDEVRGWAPLLSGRLAVSTDDGIQTVARRILEAIDDANVVHPGQPIFADRLNKKRLLSLPDGAVLLSNCTPAQMRGPLVVESLPPVPRTRENLADNCSPWSLGHQVLRFCEPRVVSRASGEPRNLESSYLFGGEI